MYDMKKQIIVLMALVGVQGLYGITDQQILQVMVSTHTRAFDRANMYEKALESEDINKWYETIQAVRDFISLNSKKNKKQLLRYLDQIQSANDQVISAIKIAYAQLAAGEEDVYEQLGGVFTSINNEMKSIQRQLEWVASNVDAENKAIKLVSFLAKFVGTTAYKADVNLNPLSDSWKKWQERLQAKKLLMA
jgi:hypothetical protein